jgi:hypothetical protein
MSIKSSEEFDLILNIYLKTSFLLLTMIALPLVFYSQDLIIALAGIEYIPASELLILTLSLVFIQYSHGALTVGFLLSNNTLVKMISQFLSLFLGFALIILKVSKISVFEMLSIIFAVKVVFLVIDFNLAQRQYKIRWSSVRSAISLTCYISLIWYVSFFSENSIVILMSGVLVSFVIFILTLSRAEFNLFVLSAKKWGRVIGKRNY